MSNDTTVTVYLANGTSKKLPVTSTTTFLRLNEMMAAKLEIPSVGDMFCVFHNQAGYERLPAPHERVLAVVQKFRADEKAFKKKKKKVYKYTTGTGSSSLVYKKAILGRRKELLCTSLPALTLLYYQAQADVVGSHIPTHGPDAIELAGIQMHIEFGDYDEAARAPGYLAENGILDRYVPARSLANKLHSPEEWEAVIFQHYAEHYGKSHLDALRAYLNTARRSKFYGGRTFHPAKCFHQGVLVSTARVQTIIASNQLMLIDPKSQKTLWSFPFSSLAAWDTAKGGSAFAFHVIPKNKKKMDPFVLETPQAEYMARSLTMATEEAAAELQARKLESIAAFKAATSPKKADPGASSLKAISKWKARAGIGSPSQSAQAPDSSAPRDSQAEDGQQDTRPILTRKVIRTRKSTAAVARGGNTPQDRSSHALDDEKAASDALAHSAMGPSSSSSKTVKRIRVRRRKKPKPSSSAASPAMLATSTV